MSTQDVHAGILGEERRAAGRATALAAAIIAVCVGALWITGFFDIARLRDGAPAIAQLFDEMVPPDFSRWQSWIRPLIDTLAMSIAERPSP